MPAGKIYKATSGSGKFRRKKTVNMKQDKRIKKLENIVYPSLEWKSKDTVASDQNVSNAGYANYPLFDIAQGDTNSTRDGDKVSLRYATLNLALTRNDSSNIVRVLVVATPSATHAGLTDVLQYPNWSTHSAGVLCSPYKVKATNMEQSYQIMMDKTYILSENVSTIIDKVKLKIPKKGKTLEFAADGSNTPQNFNVSLLAISDSTAAAHPKISYQFRYKYLDL
jgi:hypothetical protein